MSLLQSLTTAAFRLHDSIMWNATRSLGGEGDRLVVDTSRRAPATGELAVLWDGLGLVIKRVEAVSDSDPAEVRLISANSVYKPYAVPAQDMLMVRKVVWVLRKAKERELRAA